MRKQSGFTLIELVVAIVFLVAAGSIFWWQKNEIEVANRDSQRKTAINAIYYNLEEVFFKASGFYPEKLDPATVPGVDPELLKDTRGKQIGDQQSQYRYEPRDCSEGKCKGYTLRADLEQEADFAKNNR